MHARPAAELGALTDHIGAASTAAACNPSGPRRAATVPITVELVGTTSVNTNSQPQSGKTAKLDHVRRYQATDGEDGYLWNGAPVLLLTTRGRRSGKPYTTPLLFGQDGDRYLVLASRRGSDHHPEWYLNLEACPDVEVQVLDDKFAATARIADVDEKLVLWPKMVAVWPEYDDYQARTDRVIPLVIIERADSGDRPDGA